MGYVLTGMKPHVFGYPQYGGKQRSASLLTVHSVSQSGALVNKPAENFEKDDFCRFCQNDTD